MGINPGVLVNQAEQAINRVQEVDKRDQYQQQLNIIRGRLANANIPPNTFDQIIRGIGGIQERAQTSHRNFQAEETWLHRINADPANPQRVAEQAWLTALPAPRREQVRGVLASSTPVERRRLLTLQGQFRQDEFNRLADLDDQARQVEQDIVSGGMSPQENNLINALPQDQRNGLQNQLRQLAGADPGRRAEMQAAIATMSEAERHALTNMSEAQRWNYLQDMTDVTRDDFATREQIANGGLDSYEQDYILNIADANERMAEAQRLAGLSPQERGNYKALMVALTGAERNFVAGLPADQRQGILNRLNGMTAEQRGNEMYILELVNNYGFNNELADLVRDLPDNQKDEVLNWVNLLGGAEWNTLNNLTATERLRILKITDQAARDRELNRLTTLGAAVRNERGPEGRTRAERSWTNNINAVVSPYDALQEQKRIAAMNQEDRAEFQAKLAQLNSTQEMIWIMGAGSDQVEQRLNDLLNMSAAERAQLAALPNNPNVMVWYSSLPEGERAAALVQLQNLNAQQLNNINDLSPAQIRYFTSLDAGERAQKMRQYFAMDARSRFRDRLNKGVAEMPPQLRQDVYAKLNDLYNFDKISIEARNAIVTNDEEWDRLRQEFPDIDLSVYRSYLIDRSATERSILTAGENSFDSMTDLIDAELANNRISQAEHDVMRLKMEIYKELQNPSESIMERILGPENMDWLRNAGLNIQQAWPIILTALIVAGAVAGGGFAGGLFVDGAFSWAVAGGAGSIATIVRLGPTYKNYQRAKTSKKLIQLAQAERRVTFEQLQEYENKMLGGMELYAQQINNGVNPGQLQEQDPELYNYLLGLGVIDQSGNVQAENIIQNLLQFGSDHAKQVQKLESALDKRRKDIKSKKTKSDMLGEAGKGLNANVNIGGNGLQPSFI